MDARYTKAELCLIHLATALAAGGERGASGELLVDHARDVLRHVGEPSPDLVWLVSCIRSAIDAPSVETAWRLELAVVDLAVRRAQALFDPAWRVAHG